jgi:hypothetical protein
MSLKGQPFAFTGHAISGRSAPIPDLPSLATERGGSTPKVPFAVRETSAAGDSKAHRAHPVMRAWRWRIPSAGIEVTGYIADQNVTRMPPNTATGAASGTNRGSEGFATPGSGVLVTTQ